MRYSKYKMYFFGRTLSMLSIVLLGISPVLCRAQRDSIPQATRDSTVVYDIFEKLSENPPGSGKIVLSGDNVKSIIHENKTAKKNMKGYRIRIFRDNSQTARHKAEKIKADLERDYPGFPVYITHYSPDFHVEFGDFRNQDEAEKMMRTLSVSYLAATLVNVTINFPPL